MCGANDCNFCSCFIIYSLKRVKGHFHIFCLYLSVLGFSHCKNWSRFGWRRQTYSWDTWRHRGYEQVKGMKSAQDDTDKTWKVEQSPPVSSNNSSQKHRRNELSRNSTAQTSAHDVSTATTSQWRPNKPSHPESLTLWLWEWQKYAFKLEERESFKKSSRLDYFWNQMKSGDSFLRWLLVVFSRFKRARISSPGKEENNSQICAFFNTDEMSEWTAFALSVRLNCKHDIIRVRKMLRRMRRLTREIWSESKRERLCC